MTYPTVVLYHSVVADGSPADSFASKHPTREQFAAHLDYLKTRYTFVSADEFLALYEGRSHFGSRISDLGSQSAIRNPQSAIPRPPCLLTFDDGHRQLLDNALPVMAAHRVPCIIFVVAGTLDGGPAPWYIAADCLVRGAEGREVRYLGRAFDCTSLAGAWALKAAFKKRFIALGGEGEQRAALEELSQAVGRPLPALGDLPADMAFLSPDEVKAAGAHELVTIGSHALSHRNLAALSAEEQERELARSFEILKALTGAAKMTVSYPDSSHNAATRELARRYYEFGFAVGLGASRGDRFAYPRTCLGRMDVKGLKYWLSFRRRYIVSVAKRLLGRE